MPIGGKFEPVSDSATEPSKRKAARQPTHCFGQVPEQLISDRRLTAGAVRTYAFVAMWNKDGNGCRKSTQQIADGTARLDRNTIRTDLQALVEYGYLRAKPRGQREPVWYVPIPFKSIPPLTVAPTKVVGARGRARSTKMGGPALHGRVARPTKATGLYPSQSDNPDHQADHQHTKMAAEPPSCALSDSDSSEPAKTNELPPEEGEPARSETQAALKAPADGTSEQPTGDAFKTVRDALSDLHQEHYKARPAWVPKLLGQLSHVLRLAGTATGCTNPEKIALEVMRRAENLYDYRRDYWFTKNGGAMHVGILSANWESLGAAPEEISKRSEWKKSKASRWWRKQEHERMGVQNPRSMASVVPIALPPLPVLPPSRDEDDAPIDELKNLTRQNLVAIATTLGLDPGGRKGNDLRADIRRARQGQAEFGGPTGPQSRVQTVR